MTPKNPLRVGGGAVIDAIETLSLAGGTGCSTPLISFDAEPVAFRGLLDRFGEGQLIVLHQKMKDTPTGMAAEAMINSFIFADCKGRSFLAVKRAQAHVVTTGFF